MYTVYRVSTTSTSIYEYYSTLPVAEEATKNNFVLDTDADLSSYMTPITIYENLKEREAHKNQIKKQELINIALGKLTDDEKMALGLSLSSSSETELEVPVLVNPGSMPNIGKESILDIAKKFASCGDCGSKDVRVSAIPDRNLCKACKGTNIRVDVEALENNIAT